MFKSRKSRWEQHIRVLNRNWWNRMNSKRSETWQTDIITIKRTLTHRRYPTNKNKFLPIFFGLVIFNNFRPIFALLNWYVIFHLIDEMDNITKKSLIIWQLKRKTNPEKNNFSRRSWGIVRVFNLETNCLTPVWKQILFPTNMINC